MNRCVVQEVIDHSKFILLYIIGTNCNGSHFVCVGSSMWNRRIDTRTILFLFPSFNDLTEWMALMAGMDFMAPFVGMFRIGNSLLCVAFMRLECFECFLYFSRMVHHRDHLMFVNGLD
eukprot:24276_1